MCHKEEEFVRVSMSKYTWFIPCLSHIYYVIHDIAKHLKFWSKMAFARATVIMSSLVI